jgi:hypothetical protein
MVNSRAPGLRVWYPASETIPRNNAAIRVLAGQPDRELVGRFVSCMRGLRGRLDGILHGFRLLDRTNIRPAQEAGAGARPPGSSRKAAIPSPDICQSGLSLVTIKECTSRKPAKIPNSPKVLLLACCSQEVSSSSSNSSTYARPWRGIRIQAVSSMREAPACSGST